MTLLLDHPQARTGGQRPPGRRSRVLDASQLRASRWRVSIASAAAVLLAALSLSPLLDGGWWFPRTVVVVCCMVATGWVARLLRVAAPLIPLVQFAALVELLTLLFARGEAVWGFVPGPGAITQLREIAAQGADYAAATRAPAGPDEGLLLLIAAGVGLIALAVDTLATGLDLPGMTLIPLGVLFLVPWTIGGGTAANWWFAAVAVGWLAVLSALQSQRTALWSRGARPGAPGAAIVITVATTGLAILAGGLATLRGPVNPSASATGARSGTVAVDAMVSMRRSLVNNDPRPVITFTTSADSPEYLRLAILEVFDGEAWTAAGPSQTVPQAPVASEGPSVEYELQVKHLAGTTIPSPSGTFSTVAEWPVEWDQRTTLPQRTDGKGVQGTAVVLQAVAQDFDPADLRAASDILADADGHPADNLADPTAQTGSRLPSLARRITQGETTRFDKAVALQRWFTDDGGFEYSTEVDGGSGADALQDFLTDRVGYCEQFAATMALMARAVGIPARVAVGFTHGRPDTGAWVVRGTDAHAWPELWMGSAGWVRFEPTPGTATASEPAYTLGDAEDPAPTNDDTVADDPALDEPEEDASSQLLDPAETAAGQAAAQHSVLSVGRLFVVLLAILAVVPAAIRLGRRRRRRAAVDADAAFAEIVDTMVDLGLGQEAATPRATIALVAEVIARPSSRPDRAGAAAAALRRIQQAVEWQRYGFAAQPADERPRAGTATTHAGTGPRVQPRGDAGPAPGRSDVQLIRRALLDQATRPQRVLALVLPRSVTALGAGWGSPAHSPSAG